MRHLHSNRVRGPALISLPLALGVLALASSSASGFRGHAFGSDFGWGVADGKGELEVCTTGCKPGIAAAGNGQFNAPSDVAVNEATGHVYVLDQGNGRIEVFGHDEKYVAQFDGSETPAKAFAFGTVALTGGIAVDNTCYIKKLSGAACTSADPSNGDVYVSDPGGGAEPGKGVVDKFNAEGAYLGQLEEACGKASCPAFEFTGAEHVVTPAGIGVDVSGTVWVYQEGQDISGDVDSFTNAEPNIFNSTRVLKAVSTGFNCPGFAVDSEDNFYARKAGNQPECTELPTVAKFATSGDGLIAPFVAEETSAVAVDLSSDEVFLDNVSSVGAFSSSAVLQERFGSGNLAGGAAGLAVDHENASDSTVYVADSTASRVDVFSPEPPKPPSIEGQSLTKVTANSATLQAEIDPHGASTEFHFEYGPCASPSTCASSSYEESVPVPEGVAGSDFELHSVSANPQDLVPGTTYHFRVVAHNALNEAGQVVAGPEQTFTTQAFGVFELPDGRSWELVSPPDKHGALLEPIGGAVVQASASGDAIAYPADAPTEAEPEGNAAKSQVLSTHTSGGWGSRDIAPPHEGATGQPVGNGQEYRFFSSDLSLGVVQRFGGFTPSLSAQASEQTPYLHSDYLNGNLAEPCLPAIPCYSPLVSGCPPEGEECAPGVAEHADAAPGSVFGEEGLCPPKQLCGPVFVGATPDLGHVVLRSNAPLKETQVKDGLYEWSGGQLSLLSVLPEGEGGTAVAGALGERSGADSRHAISADGSRVVWMTNGGQPHLYLYEKAREGSIRLDIGLKGTPEYQSATADVSQVLFTDEGDLYQYDVAGEALHRLTEGAGVVGTLPGTSEDASFVYFVANSSKLAEGAVAGKCGNDFSTGTHCNLYVLHSGTIGLVAVLSGEDNPDWANLIRLTGRVSPDGRFLAFMSNLPLSGYDNRDALSGQRDEEVFLYDASRPTGSGNPACVSCDPSGARPTGVEYGQLGLSLVGFEKVWRPQQWLAANIPGWTPYSEGQALYQSRYLSDSGRLFFNSNEALSPQDVNGTWDVYQYEPPGVGSCSSESPAFDERSRGCNALISSGTSPEESALLDASDDGSDVFFLTAARLSSRDRDTALDVYDAHVCSTQSPCVPNPPPPPPPCGTEASCKPSPTPQPEIFGFPPSATFSGIGNIAPAPPAAVTSKPLTRAQKLAKALSTCRKRYRHSKSKRRTCERHAKKQYAAKARAKLTHRSRR